MIARRNNLEWPRLVFALQVVVEHAAEHLQTQVPAALVHFPGVPAFFFVSGLLVYSAYLNAPGRTYLENRFLRLFPGLLVVTLGGAAVALVAHGARDLLVHPWVYSTWALLQVTIGQAYNPALFRDIGVGAMNGSLWTITTEVIFYACVPVIVRLERSFKHVVLVAIAASLLVYTLGPQWLRVNAYRNKSAYDILALTPLAWGWMFGFGILAAKHFAALKRVSRYFPLLVLPMLLMMGHGDGALFGASGNRLGLVYFVCYAALVFWLAFGVRYVPLAFDLSYGAYIWHMPIINLLLVLALPQFAVAVVLTVAVAGASWFLIEKPALRLKRQSMNPRT